MFVMAVVLCGRLAHRLSRQNAGLEKVLAVIATLFVAAQLALAFGICVAIQLAALIWFVAPRLRGEVDPLTSSSRREFRGGASRVSTVKLTPHHEVIMVEPDLRAGMEW